MYKTNKKKANIIYKFPTIINLIKIYNNKYDSFK